MGADERSLFKVVEKTFSRDRRNFILIGGVWWSTRALARSAAARLAPSSLAHRMFIVSTNNGVVEEIELEPLVVRMERAHTVVLASKDPGRLARGQDEREDRARRVSEWSSGF